MFSELQAANSWLASDHLPERNTMPHPHVMVRHSLDLMNTTVDLDVESTLEGLSFVLVDTDRIEDANPVASFALKVRGTLVLLEAHDWREHNEPTHGPQQIVLYDLSDILAEPLPDPEPGVLLKIDGGVIHDVLTNVAGLQVRAFDQDKFEECGPDDPDLGMIVYPVEHGSLNTEADWARYRPEETRE